MFHSAVKTIQKFAVYVFQNILAKENMISSVRIVKSSSLLELLTSQSLTGSVHSEICPTSRMQEQH
jgi:hypothetical protein